MEIFSYLKPDNQIAFVIVVFIIILFIVWLGWLVRWLFWLRLQQRRMRRCEDVHLLTESLLAHRRRQQEEKPEATATTLPAPLPSDDEAAAVFRQFCEARSIKEKSVVANHIKTIFNAGWEESRLEVGELIKHTTNEMFMANGFLRSLLATFIIVGILGTLFGLADGLSQMSHSMGGTATSSEALSQGLNNMLAELKSAFAPSIWGVGFTIIGVLVFNVYLQFGAAPTRNTLEQLSLTTWIPQLYPTVSQRLLETLQRSEQQMEISFHAAQKVAVFAETIEGEVTNLDEKMRSANGALDSLAQTSSSISHFAAKFTEGVGKLVPFQQDLRTLYQQMMEESKAFQASVRDSNARSEAIQQQAHSILAGQHQQLQTVLGGLKSYETAYITERQQIDSKLQEVLDAARNAFGDIGERNKELVAAVGDPIRTELIEKLGEVENTLRVQLQGIQNRFASFDAPINKAAEQIEGSLMTVVQRFQTLTSELKNEFLQQNRTHHEQLAHLNRVNNQIPGLLENLAKVSQDHDEDAQLLSNTMTNLLGGVQTLDQSLGTLSQTITLPEADAEEIGTVQAGALLLQLFRESQEQREKLNLLLEEVYNLRRNTGAPRGVDKSRPYSGTSGPGTRPYAPGGNAGDSYRQTSGPTRMGVVQNRGPEPSAAREKVTETIATEPATATDERLYTGTKTESHIAGETRVEIGEADAPVEEGEADAVGAADALEDAGPPQDASFMEDAGPVEEVYDTEEAPPIKDVAHAKEARLVEPQRSDNRRAGEIVTMGTPEWEDQWKSGISFSDVWSKIRFWRKDGRRK
jgi:methyl-accepting chemotaxis protein